MGGYSATVVDPADDFTFWTIQEYAGAMGQANMWGTWWAKITMMDAQLLASPGDLDGNGKPEVAVLGKDATGQVGVQIRDAWTGANVKFVAFMAAYDPSGIKRPLAALPDANGNGKPEIVVGLNPATGRAVVQVQDAGTGAWIVKRGFMTAYSSVFGVQVLPSVGGGPAADLAVLTVNPLNGKTLVQMRDGGTGAWLGGIFFLRSFPPGDFTEVPNYGGGPGPELAVLGTNALGRSVVQVRDAGNKAWVKKVIPATFGQFFPGVVDHVADTNGNGSPEVMLGMLNPTTNAVLALIRDGLTGKWLKATYFSKQYSSSDYAVLGDVNGNGSDELMVLGTNAAQQTRVQVKDSKTGAWVGIIPIP